MRVLFHPLFAQDLRQFTAQYQEVSGRLAMRFCSEVDDAIQKIKEAPSSAGHFLNTGSKIVREIRRKNLVSFPASFSTVGTRIV